MLVRHKITGRIGKVIDKEGECNAVRYTDDNELRWEMNDSLVPYEKPKNFTLELGLTIEGDKVQEFESEVVPVLRKYDVSGIWISRHVDEGDC